MYVNPMAHAAPGVACGLASGIANPLKRRPAQETTVQKYEQFATRPKVFQKTFGCSVEKLYFCSVVIRNS